MKIKPVYFIPAIVWFIIANILFLMPGPDVPSVSFLDEIYFDKWVHAGLFAMLTFLFSWPFRKIYPARHRLFVSIAVLALLYGITMEYVQEYFTTDRDFDFNDMLADGFGCLVGYIAARYIATRIRLKEKNKPL